MKLLFQNSMGEERVIAEVDSCDEAVIEINKFCDERNFNIPYMRTWGEGERMCIDVGSHTEFFIVDGFGLEDM